MNLTSELQIWTLDLEKITCFIFTKKFEIKLIFLILIVKGYVDDSHFIFHKIEPKIGWLHHYLWSLYACKIYKVEIYGHSHYQVTKQIDDKRRYWETLYRDECGVKSDGKKIS